LGHYRESHIYRYIEKIFFRTSTSRPISMKIGTDHPLQKKKIVQKTGQDLVQGEILK
jgi:hypothetical protein